MIQLDHFKWYLGEMHRRWLIDHHPRKVIDEIWLRDFGYTVDWSNPRDLNEKIEWLICYGDTSLWPQLADKFKVRKFVEEKGYAHLLTKLYGKWDKAKDIDFESLPDHFVLKCNHDSGSTCIVNKSDCFDNNHIVDKFEKHLKNKYGFKECEPHYNKIKPLVIAEELLPLNNDQHSISLIDYKVWCFHGKPFCVWTVYNRTKESMYTNVYDLNWKVHPEWSIFNDFYRDGKGVLLPPECLDEMLNVAADLSKGFPQVRVDFYVVNKHLYFGEMTFTSMCGRMPYFTKDYLEIMGQQVKISQC